MKNKKTFCLLVLLLIVGRAMTQTFGDPTNSRPNPTIKQEKLAEIKQISDLTIHLWESMKMPLKEREKMNENRKMRHALGYYAYPQGSYRDIITYEKVSVGVRIKGRFMNASSFGEELSDDQKKLIQNADNGSDIGINIQFRHKDPDKKNLENDELVTGWTTVTVVPHVEAEFPGGYTAAATFISANLIKKMKEKDPQVTVSFLVDENGIAGQATLTNMSPDAKAEGLLRETIAKMPVWKPAKNSKGEKQKQFFSFQFGNGGC